jgi:hypothetical protein
MRRKRVLLRRRGLLQVVAAAALLVVAVPTMASAHEHLSPVDSLGRGDLTVAATEKAACSVDPRDPRLMQPGAQLCNNAQPRADQVPTGQERALIQHLVPEGTDRIDPAPAPSDGSEIEIWLWMFGVVVVAGGIAGLIVGQRRGRPHAYG